MNKGQGVALHFYYGDGKEHWVTMVECAKTETGEIDLENSVYFDPYTGLYRTGAEMKSGNGYGGFSPYDWQPIGIQYRPSEV